jgi:hypothetical protein
MTLLDLFALIVLAVLLLTVLAVLAFLAILPGKIASRRNHPQADAVRVAGWIGILTGGILWPLAIVWSFYRSPADTAAALRLRVKELEGELAKVKGAQS